ncbi:hypothetical protein N780_02765 [Pontibacillus chungwhensis BH030062]|uniref:Uncharacterized protein n=1 Tax=Pontibacillus chungwhensis BH030062 TaxID=1385513 RepID=A0A0A2UWR6_9BACI|nr:hypothetical protein N780_02765 [Pontibacillus chungwhensis BH030062]
MRRNGNAPYLEGRGLRATILSWTVHLNNDRAGLGTARLPRGKEPREDPTESEANEEASQLPAGKRVVPKPALATFDNGLSLPINQQPT